MAFDKNQLVMHQLQVKAQRLESGLARLVGALKVSGALSGGDEAIIGAYDYALGCLGGDYLKKELFATDAFECVVMQLKEQKFMKADTADKNIELWRQKHVVGKAITGTADSSSVSNPVAVRVDDDKTLTGMDFGEKPAETVKTLAKVGEDGSIEIVGQEEHSDAGHGNAAGNGKDFKIGATQAMTVRGEFGIRDAEGRLVPRESTQMADYAEPVPCETKSGRRQTFGGGNGGDEHRRIIECF